MQHFEDIAAIAIRQLFQGGAFLMTGKDERNPMTIGWCQFGRVWAGPVCTVLVRYSRHSMPLLERDGVFTVCFPLNGAMKEELGFCGTKSGRDVNKLEALGLRTIPARAGGVDGLDGCGLHVECRVIYRADMAGSLSSMEEARRKRYYDPKEQAGEDGDPHIIYFGEVLDAYLTEEYSKK